MKMIRRRYITLITLILVINPKNNFVKYLLEILTKWMVTFLNITNIYVTFFLTMGKHFFKLNIYITKTLRV